MSTCPTRFSRTALYLWNILRYRTPNTSTPYTSSNSPMISKLSMVQVVSRFRLSVELLLDQATGHIYGRRINKDLCDDSARSFQRESFSFVCKDEVLLFSPSQVMCFWALHETSMDNLSKHFQVWNLPALVALCPVFSSLLWNKF
jgi:hypothetical protein